MALSGTGSGATSGVETVEGLAIGLGHWFPFSHGFSFSPILTLILILTDFHGPIGPTGVPIGVG